MFTGGAHVHFERNGDLRELVEQVFGLVRDLLSPDMRVRERCAGGKPFRRDTEITKKTKAGKEL